MTSEEAREVEELLETSEDARRELAELQATVDLVRGLPELEPPRSFALDAAPERRWTLWWPSVRTTGLATSVAAMLLVALVAGEMLDVLEQARFGADDEEAMYDSAFDDSAFVAAAPAQEAMAEVAMDAPASPEPEVALMESAAAQDDSAQVPAAPAAAAPRMAKVESSEEPVAAMQQADAAESDEEPQVAVQSVMAADAPEAGEAESSEEPVAVIQQTSTDDGEIIEGYDHGDEFYGIDERDPDGITLPLVEFQVVTAIVVVALVGATLVAIRRRRRSIL